MKPPLTPPSAQENLFNSQPQRQELRLWELGLEPSDLEARVQKLLLPPHPRVQLFDDLEQVLAGTGRAIEALMAHIHQHPETIVVDFNWTNFATFITHQSWGIIENLHPRASLQRRNLEIRSLLELPVTCSERRLLQGFLTSEAQKNHRAEIWRSMLQQVVQQCLPHQLVITEQLNVQELAASPHKKAVLEDLRWADLLDEFALALEPHQIQLVLIERFHNSLRCPKCGHTSHKNRIKNRYSCEACGFLAAPDLVAGLNLWARWLQSLPVAQNPVIQPSPTIHF
jgi:ssDNA-binding Zn-finger/Zn-ribbon topoisomerase 1